MQTAQVLSPTAEQAVNQLVREDLKRITAQGISIREVRVTSGEDQDGDPYHHIVVVYSGKDYLLEPRWLNGFSRRNQEELAKWNIHTTTESYVEATEDNLWSSMMAAPPQEGGEE